MVSELNTLDEIQQPGVDIHSYDKYLIAFSGGKDSIALFLYLLESGVDKSKIELWHHDIDGRVDSHFMDWPITRAYCEAFAKAFDVPIYFSWKQGGFKREMLRENAKTSPVCFEDENRIIHTVGGEGGKISTRLKYPQVSADLTVRWCSSYLKISVMDSAIINQPRFNNSRTLVLSGERGEESAARSKYNIFEPDRADNRKKPSYTKTLNKVSKNGKKFKMTWFIEPGKKDRHVDRLRAIRDWSELQVWELIRKYKIRPHPAYVLGFSRTSCLFCIFGNKDQFRSAYEISPKQGDEIIEFEKLFGCTIKRNESVEDLISKGKPYVGLANVELVNIARSTEYPLSIFMDVWELPAGAFGTGCGPT